MKIGNKEHPIKGLWRPIAAGAYILICLFDFIAMPLVYSSRHSPEKIVELTLKYSEPSAQIKALDALQKNQEWNTLTTQGGGIFHISFGVILGASAHGRSKEKQAKIAAGSDDDGDMV